MCVYVCLCVYLCVCRDHAHIHSYFTVLSFGMLMTAYLKWAGMPESILGVTRGIGAGFGITATFVFPWFVCTG